jgi:hypothetical protein
MTATIAEMIILLTLIPVAGDILFVLPKIEREFLSKLDFSSLNEEDAEFVKMLYSLQLKKVICVAVLWLSVRMG